MHLDKISNQFYKIDFSRDFLIAKVYFKKQNIVIATGWLDVAKSVFSKQQIIQFWVMSNEKQFE